jgi:hypothetical protein
MCLAKSHGKGSTHAMFNFNAANREIIALLLPETGPEPATVLVRRADGQMALEAVARDSNFARESMTTGCFRRGKPIVDPVSREVMGYEMEMVPAP